MKKLSHYDKSGHARMVDVSAKGDTKRTATAHAFVRIRRAVLKKLPKNPKGDPLEVARIAGISAAKKTSDLIPMCHPLMLSHVALDIKIEPRGVRIRTAVSTTGPTGVEMEALTAASIAALTVYDMTKALDKGIEIQDVYLLEKTGGKSGAFKKKHGASKRKHGDPKKSAWKPPKKPEKTPEKRKDGKKK
jgi:cyclic pyranopterin phosphate synthase